MRIFLFSFVIFCLTGCVENTNAPFPSISSEQNPTETGTIESPQSSTSILDPSGSGAYAYTIISENVEKETVQIHHIQ